VWPDGAEFAASPRAAVSPARGGIGSGSRRADLGMLGFQHAPWDASGRTAPLGRTATTPPYDAIVTIRFANCARAPLDAPHQPRGACLTRTNSRAVALESWRRPGFFGEKLRPRTPIPERGPIRSGTRDRASTCSPLQRRRGDDFEVKGMNTINAAIKSALNYSQPMDIIFCNCSGGLIIPLSSEV